MNLVSSRSHAVFTVTLQQVGCSCMPPADLPSVSDESGRGYHSLPQVVKTGADPEEKGGKGLEQDGGQTINSKLTFVDLAGSERLKRTGAEGDRMREGIGVSAVGGPYGTKQGMAL
jgi:hypothetical protein